MNTLGNDLDSMFYKKPEPISLVNEPKIEVKLSKEAKEELNKAKIKTVFDEARNTLLDEVEEVSHKLRLEQDHIIAEFIYNWDVFNARYEIPKEKILDAFEFYLDYYDQVERIKENKLQNIIIRKIKKFFRKRKHSSR